MKFEEIYSSKNADVKPRVVLETFDNNTSRVLFKSDLPIKEILIHKTEITTAVFVEVETDNYNDFINSIRTSFEKCNSNENFVKRLLIYPDPQNQKMFLCVDFIFRFDPIVLKKPDSNKNFIGIMHGNNNVFMNVNDTIRDYSFIKNFEASNSSEQSIEEFIESIAEYDNRIGVAKYIGKNNSFYNRQQDESTKKNSPLFLTRQEREIFDPDSLKVHQGSKNSEIELNELIGLNNVKQEIRKLKAKLSYRQKQKSRGIFVNDAENLHMCFTGSPGTGKTTVARLITGILYDMGYIKENEFIEINGENLKGAYSGQTAIKTKIILKCAKNRVLFIDEAYALYDNYENGFGAEAVATILKHLEDERDNTVIIFAGYKKEMEEFLKMNQGLKSRINRFIDFEDYSTEEMAYIFLDMIQKRKMFITKDAFNMCLQRFNAERRSPNFSNARFVRNYMERIESEHAYNQSLVNSKNFTDTIFTADIPKSDEY